MNTTIQTRNHGPIQSRQDGTQQRAYPAMPRYRRATDKRHNSFYQLPHVNFSHQLTTALSVNMTKYLKFVPDNFQNLTSSSGL